MNTFKSTTRARSLQRGMSMVELSVVLVVVALISVAVFFGLQANNRRIETSDNTSQITEMSAELKKKFGRANQYAALTTAIAVQSRAVPEQLRLTPTTAGNSYGGAIVVGPAACTAAADCAQIDWPNVPQNQCMDLVIGTQNVARQVQVDGVDVKPLDGALVLATLATQCEAAPNVALSYRIAR